MNYLGHLKSLASNVTSTINRYYKSVTIIAALLGGFVVVVYCMKIQFYPSGLTITDTLFFIWTAILFGFIYSLFLMINIVAANFVVHLFAPLANKVINKKYNKKIDFFPVPNDYIIILIYGILVFLSVIIIYLSLGISISTLVLVLFFLGFLYVVLSNLKISGGDKLSVLGVNGKPIKNLNYVPKVVVDIILIASIGIPMFVSANSGAWGKFTNKTFEIMGVRRSHAVLVLEKVIYRIIKEEAIKNKIDFIDDKNCRKYCILENVTVLFNGVGKNILIRIGNENNNFEMIVPESAIKSIIRK